PPRLHLRLVEKVLELLLADANGALLAGAEAVAPQPAAVDQRVDLALAELQPCRHVLDPQQFGVRVWAGVVLALVHVLSTTAPGGLCPLDLQRPGQGGRAGLRPRPAWGPVGDGV